MNVATHVLCRELWYPAEMDGVTVIGVRKSSKDDYVYHFVPSKWLIQSD